MTTIGALYSNGVSMFLFFFYESSSFRCYHINNTVGLNKTSVEIDELNIKLNWDKKNKKLINFGLWLIFNWNFLNIWDLLRV